MYVPPCSVGLGHSDHPGGQTSQAVQVKDLGLNKCTQCTLCPPAVLGWATLITLVGRHTKLSR